MPESLDAERAALDGPGMTFSIGVISNSVLPTKVDVEENDRYGADEGEQGDDRADPQRPGV